MEWLFFRGQAESRKQIADELNALVYVFLDFISCVRDGFIHIASHLTPWRKIHHVQNFSEEQEGSLEVEGGWM